MALTEKYHPQMTGRMVSFIYPDSKTGQDIARMGRIIKVLFNGEKVQTIRTKPVSDSKGRAWLAFRLDKVIGTLRYHD